MQPKGSMLAAVLFSTAAFTGAFAEPAMTTDQELMDLIKDAAPAAVLKDATILHIDTNWQLKSVQEGTGGFDCMNTSLGAMCADAAGMTWVVAWRTRAPPPQKLGIIYMLKGDNGASNTDPYATEETANNNWIKTGPHLMIVGAQAKSLFAAYPRDAKPDPTKPYVMWPGTAYEHLVLPVK